MTFGAGACFSPPLAGIVLWFSFPTHARLEKKKRENMFRSNFSTYSNSLEDTYIECQLHWAGQDRGVEGIQKQCARVPMEFDCQS